MSSERFLGELQSIFDEVLGTDSMLTMETTAEEIEEWDSLSHFELVVSIEQRFGVKVTSQETQELGNIRAICELLDRKLGPQVA